MSSENPIILLQKNDDKLLFGETYGKNTLALIPSFLCTQYSCDLTQEDPLLKAYQDKALSQEQNYLPFYFPQRLQNKLECFFAPSKLLCNAQFAMLDLSLPSQIPIQEICVLFVYPTHSLICFYQNQILQYCKKIRSHKEELEICKHHIQTLFDYHLDFYCLSYLKPLPQELAHLTPLSSFFTSSPLDEGLYFESITLCKQDHILTLSTPPPQTHHLARFMLCSLLFCGIATSLFCFFTHSPSPIQNNDSNSLQILSTLHSLPSNQTLFVLLQELNQTLQDNPILSLDFSYGEFLRIEFPSKIPPHLIHILSSKGYISKIYNPTTLEIAL